ncbi:beta-lactam sensor/signal transducer MecR1 [Mammaliicoccus fleurettii]|uniref:beta-lactam sensor/signal transducer MecR1 n=1 Tax=Mammaliicoccus fleurettii TaxID=150056 RepID=UPI002DBED5A1|nr:beta-lactam sensor/signal transducer MecR1 [Mammaliicoccus fleurettii]MEB7779995.1 beta-lactam sensor/signal transducer MecR1 [Mammaliicoccus fleurettii]
MLSSFLMLSIISSLLTICVIFLVRMIYIKYTQNIMSHKIWLLVLVSTLIPLIPFYKISNFTFSKDMMNRNVSDTTSSVSHMLDGQQSSVTKDLAINVNQFETSNITYMILLIWVFGSLLCLFYMIKAFRQIDIIKSSSLESPYLNERLKVCQSKMQFYKKHITISYSSNIDNPMVFGIVKSQIVLPTVVVETMNDKEIEYIILHELSHVKSHDLIFNQLYVVFKIIFWFNPALYISKTMMDNDCEKVCDRNVLKILNRHEHIRYGESILKCSILKSHHINNVAAQYLLGFNSNIKERVKYIALYDSMPKPNRNKRIVAYIVCSISLLIQAPLLSAHVQQDKYETNVSYKKLNQLAPYFKEFDGSFVLYNEREQAYSIYNEPESKQRYSPNSTYKIYLALMAFDQNLLSLNHTEQQWDKHQYPFKEWNQDQNLNSSMKYSVNWYYENLNKHLRQDEVKSYLDQIEYGNEEISGNENYWNESSLKISAIEQVNLLKNMKQHNMHFDNKAIEKVENSMTLKQKDTYKYVGKTGTGIVNHKEANGWFVGYVETKDNTYYFATHLKGEDNANGEKSQQISERILKEMELI